MVLRGTRCRVGLADGVCDAAAAAIGDAVGRGGLGFVLPRQHSDRGQISLGDHNCQLSPVIVLAPDRVIAEGRPLLKQTLLQQAFDCDGGRAFAQAYPTS